MSPASEILGGCFGFDPGQSVAHFLVHIPEGSTLPVDISENLSWNPEECGSSIHYDRDRSDGQVRCRLARSKWNAIADAVRAEFNARLRKESRKPGKWKAGFNAVSRTLGKELTLLAWAIEDADPALIPAAIANWHGLSPEERWWLYTMTAAATGHFEVGRSRGWRKAVRFALTENPVTDRVSDQPVVPEFFRLVSESVAREEGQHPSPPERPLEQAETEYRSSRKRTRKGGEK
jgi:hypothetical protein